MKHTIHRVLSTLGVLSTRRVLSTCGVLSTRRARSLITALVVMLSILILVATGCAPRASEPADATNEPLSDTVPITWSMQSDCATCHTTEAGDTDAASHPQAAAHNNLSCVECHTAEPVLSSTHEGVKISDKPASKVTELTVDEQTCIGCHGPFDEVALKTADSEALKDDQGTVVNPHQRPAGATHSENPASCTSCHNNHSSTLPRDAKKYCTQCHHRGIWQCGTCHEKR